MRKFLKNDPVSTSPVISHRSSRLPNAFLHAVYSDPLEITGILTSFHSETPGDYVLVAPALLERETKYPI